MASKCSGCVNGSYCDSDSDISAPPLPGRFYGNYPEGFIAPPTFTGRMGAATGKRGNDMGKYDGYPSVVESDGIERPGFVPVSAFRPTVKYLDMGRVTAMSRTYRASTVAYGCPDRFVGFINVHDDGMLFCTPDQVSDGRYHALRWVGGFRTRMECVQYLRAHREAAASWWKEAAPAE